MYQEDLMYQKTAEKRILFSCKIDLTFNCNLNCIHCYICKEDRPEMDTRDIKNIIDQLAALGTLYLDFSGGEIFTREDFFEIAEYARNQHFALNISTNGTLIDREIVDKLLKLKPFRVSLSVYSTKPKIHDKITGMPGSLEKTIKSVKMLKNHGLNVRINNIIMKQNLNDYPIVHQMAKKLGLDFKLDPQITPKTDGNTVPLNNQINDEELFRILADPLLNRYSREKNTEKPNTDLNDFPCSAAQNFCYISPYGDVFPCVQFPLLCGNIKEKSINEIWYHSPQMLKASGLRMSNLPVCSKCEIIDYCRYCPGLSIIEENDIMKPPIRCCKEAEILSKINEAK